MTTKYFYMISQRILFIGGGNMSRAIISALIKNNYPPSELIVVDRNINKRDFFLKEYKIIVANELAPDLFSADVIVLSVKPQSAQEICLQLCPLLQHKKPLIISVMAGITINTLNEWLGKNIPIVRAMPNICAVVQAGATGLFASPLVLKKQQQLAESLLSSFGVVAWLEEEAQINTITALSGSGPAYFFYMIEAMQIAAVQLGLPEKIAKEFSIQTAYGAALLAHTSDKLPATLRTEVTSKKGTTEAALTILEQENVLLIVEKAMRAARDRAEELSELHSSPSH